MSALLSLCNSVITPVDHAAEFTDRKDKKVIKIDDTPIKKRSRMPYYSPLWYEKPTIKGESIIKLNKKGFRVKKCSNCKRWKNCDTKYFDIDKHRRNGILQNDLILHEKQIFQIRPIAYKVFEWFLQYK